MKGKASGSGSNKATNAHVLVPTTVSIQVVNDKISVALYAASHDCWMIDSGATHHITPHKSDFSSYSLCTGTVKLGDKLTVSQIGVGTVIFKMSQGTKITLSNVLHVPDVKTGFIGVHALTKKGAQVSFDNGSCKIVVNGKIVATGYSQDDLYWIDYTNANL
jgi:hypothetical protein